MSIRLQAVCFDLDGTLVDSMDMHMRTLCLMVKEELGVDCDPLRMKSFIGIPTQKILANFAPPDQIERLTSLWMDYEAPYRSSIKLFPGIEENLLHLKTAGLKLGVVTSQNRDEMAIFRNLLKLEDCIDVWISKDDSARPKPAGDPVLVAAERLGCTVQQMVMIGDTIYDLQAGRAAGARTGAAFWGETIEADMLAIQPDFIFRTTQELETLIPLANFAA